MTNDELRAALDGAKVYQAEKMAAAEASVEAARLALRAAEERHEAWRRITPLDVLEIMREDSERDARTAEDAARARKIEAAHAAALREAYEHGKGILPPEAASKSNTFGGIGCIVFGACTMWIFNAYFGVDSYMWLTLLGGIGGVVGLFAGFMFFDAHFVVDESLERGVFKHFNSRAAIDLMYFKRRL